MSFSKEQEIEKFWSHSESKFYTKTYEDITHSGILRSAESLLPNAIRDMIAQNPSLSYPDEKHNHFNSTGDFRCPCCKNKITMFSPGLKGELYSISNWGNCSHFGFKGEFPNDAIGIYMAMLSKTGTNTRAIAKEVIQHQGSLFSKEIDLVDEAKEKKAEKDKTTLENMNTIKTKALWGDNIPEFAKKLLLTRAIDIDKLDDATKNLIGYVDTSLKKLTEDKTYTAKGIVFALKDKNGEATGYQIRKINKYNKFVSKPKGDSNKNFTRFITIGDAYVFNANALEFANALNPVFIFEGPMDAISAKAALMRKDQSDNLAATMSIQGCSNLSYVISKLFGSNGGSFAVYLALDSDDKGFEAQMKITDELRKNKNITILPFPGFIGKKDMNELLMANKDIASVYMQMVHSIGRHMMDGRISQQDGINLLLDMGCYTLKNFDNRCRQTIRDFNKAIEKRKQMMTPVQAGLEKENKEIRQDAEDALTNANKKKGLRFDER